MATQATPASRSGAATAPERSASRIDLPTSLIGSVLILLLALLQFVNPAVIETVRLKVFDELQARYPRPAQDALPVTIVDIDDLSLSRIGQWPWPRSIFAELFDRLGEYGAVVITCDILFAEADRYSPPVYANEIARMAPTVAESLRGLPDYDASMAEAMLRNTVVLGVAGIPTVLDASQTIRRPSPVVALGEDPRDFLPEFDGMVGALPILAEAASGVALVTLTPDVDGIVRRVPLVGAVGGQLLPSLSLETLRQAVGADKIFVRTSAAGLESVIISGVSIPVDRVGRAWVRYAGRQPEQYVSASDVLQGKVAADRFEGHVVFIGASAAALGDIKAAPIVGTMPGVEIQTSLLHSLLAPQVLRRPATVEFAEIAALVLIGLVLAWAGPFLRAGYLPALLGLGVAAGVGATWYAFRYHQVFVDGIYFAAAMGVLLFWLAMARFVREEARRRTIRNAFSRYLSPVMVDRLTSSATALNLGGERRELTVLFSDIRGFTTLSEHYEDDPEGLTALLTRYFTAMTETITENSGTIDKYIGDAIMAFWNAPLPVPQHARQACLAALGMRSRLGALNDVLTAEAAKHGLDPRPLRIGIGLNTGICFVGNMGSEQRFNYTVIGDPVNVASRVEGRSKTYGVDIVIGESTREAARDLATLEVDRVRLVGKTTATRLFALIGDAALAQSEKFLELADEHKAMLDAYRSRNWDAAEAKLRRCRTLGSEFRLDYFYATQVELIESARHADLPDDWDGSVVAEGKGSKTGD